MAYIVILTVSIYGRVYTDYNETLASKTREKNQLLQTQLDDIREELTKYKVQCVLSSVSYRLIAASREHSYRCLELRPYTP